MSHSVCLYIKSSSVHLPLTNVIKAGQQPGRREAESLQTATSHRKRPQSLCDTQCKHNTRKEGLREQACCSAQFSSCASQLLAWQLEGHKTAAVRQRPSHAARPGRRLRRRKVAPGLVEELREDVHAHHCGDHALQPQPKFHIRFNL